MAKSPVPRNPAAALKLTTTLAAVCAARTPFVGVAASQLPAVLRTDQVNEEELMFVRIRVSVAGLKAPPSCPVALNPAEGVMTKEPDVRRNTRPCPVWLAPSYAPPPNSAVPWNKPPLD